MELLKKLKSRENLRQTLYFLLLLSLFFPLRHVFYSNSAFQTGSYSDFTSFSLYLSDLCILGLLGLSWQSLKSRVHHVVFWLATWIWLIFVLNLPNLSSLNLYFLTRFLLLVLFYFLVVSDKKFPINTLIKWFIALSALESLISLGQFLTQRSLGLYQLGESHLGVNIVGVAKIVSHGTKFIRGYGTFPHPNLFSAFLFTAILFSLYKIFISTTRKQKLWYSALLVINIFGLIVTFSRAGIGTAGLVAIIFCLWLTIQHGVTKRLIWTAAVTGLAFIAAFTTFHQFISTRATVTDDAVKERVFYNRVGLNIIKAFPVQGIGFGTSMLHMQQFSPVHLESWEVQPIHNFYLLAAAEIGIVGALLWIALFLWHLYTLGRQVLKNSQQGSNDYVLQLTLLLILLGFLILMLFDHYFYTIEQTQLLLWLILGLIAGNASYRRLDT
jgi:O-antigen ligase